MFKDESGQMMEAIEIVEKPKTKAERA